MSEQRNAAHRYAQLGSSIYIPLVSLPYARMEPARSVRELPIEGSSSVAQTLTHGRGETPRAAGPSAGGPRRCRRVAERGVEGRRGFSLPDLILAGHRIGMHGATGASRYRRTGRRRRLFMCRSRSSRISRLAAEPPAVLVREPRFEDADGPHWNPQ